MTISDECGQCAQLEALPAEAIVLQTDHWAIYVNPTYPGQDCVWVQALTHVEGPWGLTDAQAASFGAVLRTAATSLREARGSQCVYVASFGENQPHYHALVIGRPIGIDRDARGVPFVSKLLASKTTPDNDAAAELAAQLRLHLPSSADVTR